MTPSRKSHVSSRDNAKRLLTTLKLTTTIGAVSLTLAGWAMLSQAEALNAANAVQATPSGFASNALPVNRQIAAPAGARPDAVSNITAATATTVPPTATDIPPTATSLAVVVRPKAIVASTVSPSATSTTAPTATPTMAPTATPTTAPTATPKPKFKLDIVQWVKTNAGDPVAVVRDRRGVLWYVWGADVPRIEQGLSPQYQPQPVNGIGRTRRS